MIRKEVYVSPIVMEQLKEIVEESQASSTPITLYLTPRRRL